MNTTVQAKDKETIVLYKKDGIEAVVLETNKGGWGDGYVLVSNHKRINALSWNELKERFHAHKGLNAGGVICGWSSFGFTTRDDDASYDKEYVIAQTKALLEQVLAY